MVTPSRCRSRTGPWCNRRLVTKGLKRLHLPLSVSRPHSVAFLGVEHVASFISNLAPPYSASDRFFARAFDAFNASAMSLLTIISMALTLSGIRRATGARPSTEHALTMLARLYIIDPLTLRSITSSIHASTTDDALARYHFPPYSVRLDRMSR